MKYPLNPLLPLQGGRQDGLSVRGPSRAKHEDRPIRKSGKEVIVAAVGIGDTKFDSVVLRHTAQESELLAVRRKGDRGVNVANQLMGRAAQDGH